MRARYGEGSIYPRGGKPDQYGKLKTGSWWVCYFRNGVMHRESAHTLVKTQARVLLKQRSAEIVTGDFVSPKDRRVTVDDLYQSLLWDYRDKANRKKIEEYWQNPKQEKPGRLKAFFGGMRASHVTTELLQRFVEQCEKDGLKSASINRLLSALRRAFNLGYQSTPRKIREVPDGRQS